MMQGLYPIATAKLSVHAQVRELVGGHRRRWRQWQILGWPENVKTTAIEVAMANWVTGSFQDLKNP